MKAAVLYLGAIAVSEVLLYFLESALGLLFYAIILVSLIAHALLSRDSNYRMFLLSMILVPLSRLTVFVGSVVTYATDTDGDLVLSAIVNPVMLLASIMMMSMLRLARHDVGLSVTRLLPQLLIGLTGITFGLGLYYMLDPEPVLGDFEATGVIAAILIIAMGAAREELMYRGILRSTSARSLGRYGVVYVSVIFSLIHVGRVSGLDLSVISIPFIFAVAIFYAYAVEKTQSLIGVILSHTTANVCLWVVLPLVSGA